MTAPSVALARQALRQLLTSGQDQGWLQRGIPPELKRQLNDAAQLHGIDAVVDVLGEAPGVAELHWRHHALASALTQMRLDDAEQARLDQLQAYLVRGANDELMRHVVGLARRSLAVQRLRLGISQSRGRPALPDDDIQARIRQEWTRASDLPITRRWIAVHDAIASTDTPLPLGTIYRVVQGASQ